MNKKCKIYKNAIMKIVKKMINILKNIVTVSDEYMTNEYMTNEYIIDEYEINNIKPIIKKVNIVKRVKRVNIDESKNEYF